MRIKLLLLFGMLILSALAFSPIQLQPKAYAAADSLTWQQAFQACSAVKQAERQACFIMSNNVSQYSECVDQADSNYNGCMAASGWPLNN